MTEKSPGAPSFPSLISWKPGLVTVLLLIFTISGASTYYLVTTGQLNVFTGMLFLSAASSFFLLILGKILTRLGVSHDTKKNIWLSLITTIFMMFAAELFLRLGLGKYSNYHEQNGNRNYVSVYAYYNTSWFHVHEPNSNVHWSNKDLAHVRQTNSLGLSEREITTAKTAGEYRIIVLGDSFTEGVGTSYASTWVKVLEKRLGWGMPGRKITAINAGISGSDCYFEYVLLREKLVALAPNLVIVAVNHSDVEDIIIRGGMDRFQSDGKLFVRRTGPYWEWIYGISYIFRHIIHDGFQYNWMLLNPEEVNAEERIAADKIALCIDGFSRLGSDRKFKILFVFHPYEVEIKDERYYPSAFNNLVSNLRSSNGIHMIDLLEYYRAGKTITKANSAEFFWQTDLHHNTKGYETMGSAIARKIVELRLVDG